ncbi:hypothetical protein SMSP2_01968 [Limihaloglobus sulfuriphilus]|uniref:Ice-binding protein C-terminal domain-containing protein n=1 Tax=Limihaloglobus sulfuriphilus TaxID=1851148 RepID=A0A1Q2MH54_9BACT|nr:PEP-CTERM sorting domain-containing protein [Limihaloglobus sulfuriphilus]AQQ71592.1 hypothetical protein SMSP2_01968 [Limihaloglobus sulfuriphilus]
MKKKTVFYLLVVLSTVCAVNANYLLNPGFEDGDGNAIADNWYFAGGNVQRETEIQAGHGEWQLQIGDLESLNWGWGEQTVDFGTDVGGTEFTASAEFKGRIAGAEQIYLNLEFYDAANALISGQDGAELKPTDPDYIEHSWVTRSMTLTAPANTQKIRYRIVGYMGGGTYGDWGVTRADNAVLVPEPASLAVLGLGALLLKRRK